MKIISTCSGILRDGFRKFLANPWQSLGVTILFLILSIVATRTLSAVPTILVDQQITAALVVGLISSLISGYLISGLFVFHLAPFSSQTGTVIILFSAGRFVLKYFMLQILSFLIFGAIFLPALFCIASFPNASWPMVLMYLSLPFALWFSIRNIFSGLVLLHQNAGVIESIRRSFEYTKDRVWLLFVALVLIFLVYLGGLILVIVGVLATASIATYMYCSLYHMIVSSNSKDA